MFLAARPGLLHSYAASKAVIGDNPADGVIIHKPTNCASWALNIFGLGFTIFIFESWPTQI
jgi:hypothetical protein